MVTASSGGVITLTSQRVLTEEQSKKMLTHVKRVKAICKDLHVNETFDAENHISYIGINYDTSINLEESLKVLNATHDHLLAEIDNLGKDDIEDSFDLKEEIRIAMSNEEKKKALDELRKCIMYVLFASSQDAKKLAKFALIVDGILSMIDSDNEEHENIETDQPE